jgi:hypothetical protein
MGHERSDLVRVSQDELRLVKNFRAVNPVRQDALLFFSDELVKLESQDSQIPQNVVHLAASRK